MSFKCNENFPASQEKFLSFVMMPSGTNGGNIEAGSNVYTAQLTFKSSVSFIQLVFNYHISYKAGY